MKITQLIEQIESVLSENEIKLDWKGLMSEIKNWSRKNNLELKDPKLKSLSGSGAPKSDDDAYIGIDVLGLDKKRNEVVVDTIMITTKNVQWGRGANIVKIRNPNQWEKEVIKILQKDVKGDPNFGM